MYYYSYYRNIIKGLLNILRKNKHLNLQLVEAYPYINSEYHYDPRSKGDSPGDVGEAPVA